MSPIGADRSRGDDLKARLTELESLVTHFERTVDQLNEVVTDQANRIETLERQTTHLMEIVRATEAPLSGDDGSDESV